MHRLVATLAKMEKRTVTTGCGQGTVFGDLMDQVGALSLPGPDVARIRQGTLAGMLEKDTGEEPFAVPALIREAAKHVDPRTVPLDFLSNADTTGGNSGSPVVNAKGEMVGLNFDRVWENVANDFGYNPEVARNISVDLRFLIWLLREQHGEALLAEMGVH